MTTFEELDKSAEEVTKMLVDLINGHGDFDLACESSDRENQYSVRIFSGRLFIVTVIDTGDIDESVLDEYNEGESDDE